MSLNSAEVLEVLKTQTARTLDHIRKLNEDSNYLVELDMEQTLAAIDVVNKHFENLRLYSGDREQLLKYFDTNMLPELDKEVRVKNALECSTQPPKTLPVPPSSSDVDEKTWKVIRQEMKTNNEILRLLNEEMKLMDQIIDITTRRIAQRMSRGCMCLKQKG